MLSVPVNKNFQNQAYRMYSNVLDFLKKIPERQDF